MLWLVCALCVGLAFSVPIEQVDDNLGYDDVNPEENEGLFEGDIELMPGQDPFDRNAYRNRNYRWPNGVVPFVIDTHHFSSSVQSTIHHAMDTISKSTNGCIKFKPRTHEAAYIKYQGGSGCHTPVGYHHHESGVTLGTGCSRIGTVMHETLHALGFWHEQSRPDRDSYVTIEWNNIQHGHERNFDKYSTAMIDTLGQHYDYESVMHYNAYSFAIDRHKPTILVKQRGAVIGQRTHLSPIDIKKLKIYYECK